MLLKSAVDLCLAQVKSWAIQQYYANIITLNDLHTLGFLLPGEAGGHHSKSEPTSAIAEVKVLTSNPDTIHVVIDHAAYDNATFTRHGWPPGVRQAVIVIMAADGVTVTPHLRHCEERSDAVIRTPGIAFTACHV
jgi:hypothetical protein